MRCTAHSLYSSPPVDFPTPAQVSEFYTRGLFVTEPLFSVREIETLRKASHSRYQSHLNQKHAGEGSNQEMIQARLRPFLPSVHLESAAVAAFCKHPTFVQLARKLIGDDADLAWNQALLKFNEPTTSFHTRFPFHQDGKFALLNDTTTGFACYIALNELTVENGTLEFAADAHHYLLDHTWSEKYHWWSCDVTEYNIVQGELKPGQMVVYHRMTPHGSTPNHTQSAREAFLISFAPPDLRIQETNEPFGDGVPILRDGEVVSRDAT